LPLAHCDLYRLEPGDVQHLGLDELLQGAVLVVEWAEKWLSAPAGGLHIAISGQNDSRTLRIEGPVDAVGLCRAAKEAQDTDSGH
jgi:tRNA A37 threonylcarbamoyladenosine biosynthesis protein TsaE